MRNFLPSGVPWGSPAADTVPLPPFASPADHDRFTRLLQLHVALVDDGGPSLAAKTLGSALDPRGPRSERLTDLELHTALATGFPAPWTPAALADALGGGRDAPRELPDGRWGWGFDPDFTATPREGGGWTIERHERGSKSYQDLEHDRDLVLLWAEDYSSRFSYPYGWRVDPADAAALAEGARAVRGAHAHDTSYRYLENWRGEREEYLAEG
ncbi:hypothetical protein [Glycomyces paridis]|uniref:Uncharacterized protein n=1 Tax=Glycomyces paridis TaxID=2126555 RepID=A0A4S8PJK5_9ACTN|nr:hypothetical protein [Glycomyces paridis]THV30860.1 hypothetical protein E9998_05655 [Glycomyces paridis]